MRTKQENEARSWAWASLVASSLVGLVALSAQLWPVTGAEVAAITGSWLFLFGKPAQQNTAMVLLVISTIFEGIAGVLLAIFGLHASSNSSAFVFAALFGVFALVVAVPMLALAVIHGITAWRIRALLYAEGTSEAAGEEPRNERPVLAF